MAYQEQIVHCPRLQEQVVNSPDHFLHAISEVIALPLAYTAALCGVQMMQSELQP